MSTLSSDKEKLTHHKMSTVRLTEAGSDQSSGGEQSEDDFLDRGSKRFRSDYHKVGFRSIRQRPRSRFACPLLAVLILSAILTSCYIMIYLRMSAHEPDINPIEAELALIRSFATIDTPNCRIPHMDPMDQSIKKFIWQSPKMECGQNKTPRLTYSHGKFLHFNLTAAQELHLNMSAVSCCSGAIRRVKMHDEDIKSEKCLPLKFYEYILYREMWNEFERVTCTDPTSNYTYHEYHAFAVRKRPAESRLVAVLNESSTPEHPPSRYNVFILGMDAMSRSNSHRQMNQTLKVLQDLYGAVEFKGYNKVEDNTFVNLVPVLTGMSVPDISDKKTGCWPSEDAYLDGCPFIWREYAANGYRTSYAEDGTFMSTFDYMKNGFYEPPTDYYFRPLDLALREGGDHWDKRMNCPNCGGNYSMTERMLDYNANLLEEYGSGPLWSFTWINCPSHDFVNMASSVDEFYADFLKRIHPIVSERTFLIFMSDHGIRWGSLRSTYMGMLEERLPMLYIAPPAQFREQYPEAVTNMQINGLNRLTTPYDLHATLEHILELSVPSGKIVERNRKNLKFSSYKMNGYQATSLFKPISKDRRCEDVGIALHWCACSKMIPLDLNDERVVFAQQTVVEHLNDILLPTNGSCMPVEVDTRNQTGNSSMAMLHERHFETNDVQRNTAYDDLDVSFTTLTGMKLEATVRINTTCLAANQKSSPDFDYFDLSCARVLGTVSRLNLYGSTADCVQNAFLKKYCFCADHYNGTSLLGQDGYLSSVFNRVHNHTSSLLSKVFRLG